MDMVIKRKRVKDGDSTGWRSGSRTEIPKDRCQVIVKDEFGENDSAAALCFVCVFSLYQHSFFKLMGD